MHVIYGIIHSNYTTIINVYNSLLFYAIIT